MGKLYESLTDELRTFIDNQQMFFVATAPSDGGHVNMSPKGLDSFSVIGPNEVCYLDLTGSGIETIAHLRDNGRITVMFSAFTGAPNIVRLYGTGQAVLPSDERFAELRARFGDFPGVRSVIRIDVTRISDSCGFGVPLYQFTSDRRTLTAHWAKRSDDEVIAYQDTRNAESIDGLPGL